MLYFINVIIILTFFTVFTDYVFRENSFADREMCIKNRKYLKTVKKSQNIDAWNVAKRIITFNTGLLMLYFV